MKREGIHLQYGFDGRGQTGADIENPLFDMLALLQEHGSILMAAKSSGRSYRHIWGSLKHWEECLGKPLVNWVQGKRAELTPFAQRLLWAERQARARMTPHIEALRAELQHVLAHANDSRWDVLELFASHDLGLPLLQILSASQQKLRLSLRFVGSQDALRSLLDGRCTVAGFHVPRFSNGSPVFASALRPLLQPGLHKLIGSHRRQQGLILRRNLSVQPDLREIVDANLRFVNRQQGSGTRLLLDHMLHESGVAPNQIDGYFSRIEHTHVAVAATIAAGAADVGMGVKAAAREFGLGFVPIVEEDYFLVCLKSALVSPAVVHLRQVLGSSAWSAALSSLAGCTPYRSGEVLSLTRALPWWRFSTARAPHAEVVQTRS